MPVYPATIAERVEHELEIRRSRFLTHLVPVSSPEEADEEIARIRKRHWDANHNCVAMVTGTTGDQARSSDDGEPSGTAGIPMLEVLRRRGMTDLVAVVTRYFGGVKLGAGGLVRAYGAAVSEALDHATIVERRALTRATFAVNHAEAGRFDNLLRDWTRSHDAVLGETRYVARAEFEVWTPADALGRLADDLAAWSQGSVAPEPGEVRIVDVPA
ncbi:YigZ family protein [Microbacterium sp. gxy059]|uniref:YigZ family protein n=1 Tax=Microbacterium sp. gxy059 TaxID=2957199 RepID=UPI003D96158E